jgi:cold-inducible RNA-binding protein
LRWLRRFYRLTHSFFFFLFFIINFFLMNIFVAKLDFRTESEDLKEAFEAFGVVDSAKVIMDHETGRSRGFAFVEMPNDDEALAAIDGLNETQLDGATIVVKKAEPRKPGGGGGGFKSGPRHGGGGGDYRPRDYRDSNRSGGGGGGGYGGGNRNFNRRDKF